jgi:hypothetical protein
MVRCQFSPVLHSLGEIDAILSHVTKTRVKVKDLDALDLACRLLGLELMLGQTTYTWWGHSVGDYPIPAGYTEADLGKCTHAIRVKNASKTTYEIGLVKQSDGSFDLLYDFYNGGNGLMPLVSTDGQNLKRLMDIYTIEAAKRAAEENGFFYEKNTDGTLTIFGKESGRLVVHADGTTEAFGFTGSGCTAFKPIENALGENVATEFKDEYYMEENIQTNTNEF